uniref:Odorant receptor n=1 Tax=Adelphocoris lineolatus TaxID=236346 RepID=A0A2I4PH80_ADELI|nr:olfactory receptor 72 [Adelphocoris lineolatus]
MKEFKSKTHALLLTMLEVAAIHRNPERSMFSPNGFLIYRVGLCLSYITMITSSLLYLNEEGGNQLMKMVLSSVALQFFVCSMVLISKKESITKMLLASTEVFSQLTPNDENRIKMDLLDKKSLKFAKFFAFLISMNVISGVMKGLMNSWLSGETHYPFDLSCLGLSAVPCWFTQLFSTSGTIIYIYCYFAILKLILYQLWGYVDVLSALIRDRPVSASEKDDRDLLKFYCDYGNFAVSFTSIFGITAFIDMIFTSVRCGLISYYIVMSISENNWSDAAGSMVGLASSFILPYIVCSCGEDMDEMNNQIRNGFLESNWYQCSPQSRKRLLPILTLNNVPIKFQYRQCMHFNMERFMQVLRSSYSLTTALANFM